MTIRNLTAPTAAETDCATLFVTIELSRSSWLVAVHGPAIDKIGLHRLAAGDAAGLLTLIGRQRQRAERDLARPVRVMSCYEAGYDGFWLHRLLVAHGVDNRVIDPASLLVDRRARRAKSDRIDVTGMLRSLMAYARGEPRVLSVVQVPSVDEEDFKRLHRERQRLIKERTGHVNRIKGLLAGQGISAFQPQRGDAAARLAALRTADGCPLAPGLAAEIGRQLERLALVQRMIKTVEAERDTRLVAVPGPAGDKMRLLIHLRSIGPEIASVLVGEVFYRTYDNRRQLGSYAGLTSSPFNSGAMVRDQGISKAGNKRARTTMVELAWLWLRYQPDSALSQWFLDRLGGAKGRLKRVMIVALARKLLVALWRYLETGTVPTGAHRRRRQGVTDEKGDNRGRRNRGDPDDPRWMCDRPLPWLQDAVARERSHPLGAPAPSPVDEGLWFRTRPVRPDIRLCASAHPAPGARPWIDRQAQRPPPTNHPRQRTDDDDLNRKYP